MRCSLLLSGFDEAPAINQNPVLLCLKTVPARPLTQHQFTAASSPTPVSVTSLEKRAGENKFPGSASNQHLGPYHGWSQYVSAPVPFPFLLLPPPRCLC